MQKSNESALSRLQIWYASQCDEDWEHSYGVKIDTLDNPGWIVTIDLADTELQGLLISRQRVDRSEADWAQYEVVDDKFIACGGVFNLEELVELFLEISIRPQAGLIGPAM